MTRNALTSRALADDAVRAACRSRSGRPRWTPTAARARSSSPATSRSAGSSRCRRRDRRPGQAARGAVAGGLLGAAAGAAIGAAAGGGAGRGAAIGAAAGGIGAGAVRGVQSNQALPARIQPVHAQPRPQRPDVRPVEEGGEMTMTYRVIVPLAALLGLAVAARCRRGQAHRDPAGRGRGERARLRRRETPTASCARSTPARPEYDSTKAALPGQFAREDLTVKLVDFRYMGHDDEFAIARVKTKIVGTPRQRAFQDNVVDSVMLFHRERRALEAVVRRRARRGLRAEGRHREAELSDATSRRSAS